MQVLHSYRFSVAFFLFQVLTVDAILVLDKDKKEEENTKIHKRKKDYCPTAEFYPQDFILHPPPPLYKTHNPIRRG